jgi:hypothetical protein
MVRSIVLFAHVTGMLLLFIGLSVEWLSLESLRRPATPVQASPWPGVFARLPRLYRGAFALILMSGIYLASRVGAHDFAWVRLSFAGIVLMAVLGGPLIRLRSSGVLRRSASHPLVRFSLRARAALALGIVYLMIAKPLLDISLLVTGVALAVGLVMTLTTKSLAP